MCNCLPLGRTKASELSDFPAVDTPLVTKEFQFSLTSIIWMNDKQWEAKLFGLKLFPEDRENDTRVGK